MPVMTPKTQLSPNRRQMLRLVRYSEITREFNGACERSYHDTGAAGLGVVDGHGTNALDWLESNGFIRCVGEPVAPLGLRAGAMRPTMLGEEWLAANRVLR